jgi:hypoxanthine phosphoribosyltransferase
MDELTEPRTDDAWDETPLAPEREVLTWERFGTAARELAQIVADDGYEPDVVIAIARGGLTVAGALAYALGVKNCGSMNVEFYTGVDQRLDVPVVLPPTLDLVDVRGLRVLVADDVADTGHTLRLVREVLAQHVAEARTAVLYRKPRSVVAPDYAWHETDEWIVFPWSAQPPVTSEPATSLPAAGGPVTSEPVTTTPVPGEPVPGDPATGEPVTNEPIPGEPVPGAGP